jgi:membrane-associated protein
MEQLTDAAVAAASSPWVYAIVFALTVLDAFLVVVPSETVVVALGALALSSGSPQLGLLIPVAAAAAIAGDSLTYWLGRSVGLERFRWMRSPRAVRVFDWARRSLDQRAAALLMTARFVPFGRVAVNLVAGTTGFAYPRFLGLTAVAGVCWAGYNAVVGALFGTWFEGAPIVAVATSVVVALVLGFMLDRVSARLASSRNTVGASGSKYPSRSRPARGTKDTDGQTGGSS